MVNEVSWWFEHVIVGVAEHRYGWEGWLEWENWECAQQKPSFLPTSMHQKKRIMACGGWEMYLFIIMPLRKYDLAGLGHVPVHRTKGRKTDWMDQGSSILHKSSSRVNILAGTDFTPIEEKLVKLSPPCQAWLEPGRKSSHVWSCPTSSRGGWWFRQSGFPEECKVPEQQKYKLPTKEIQVAYKRKKGYTNCKQTQNNLAADHSSCLLPRLFYRAEGHFDPVIENSDNSFHIRTCTNLSLNPLP